MATTKVLGMLFMSCIFCYAFYTVGKVEGKHEGIDRAFDTVMVIVDRQMDSDTSVTELIIANPDTNVYFLSRKTLLESR